jgi:hypothetical protein
MEPSGRKRRGKPDRTRRSEAKVPRDLDQDQVVLEGERDIGRLHVGPAREPADILLKPHLDAIWNATGHPASLNYDDQGRGRDK